MTANYKCCVCGEERDVGRKTCGKQQCMTKSKFAPTGPVPMDKYPEFKQDLINCDELAVELAREQSITQMYCKITNRLWLDEGVALDLSLCKTLKYPDIYRGIRGKVEEPYTDNEGVL